MSGTANSVAVVGAGYWGKNLIRNFHELGVLGWVCDTRVEALEQIAAGYPVRVTTDFATVLKSPEVRAVVIAVPAAQHYKLAKQAILSGKDVFVEKPLTLNSAEGQELVELAERYGRVLMVGHILQYHPAILELKRLIKTGELGRIQYIYSSRLNLGKLRTEENILWSFAPHDISAVLYLLEEVPTTVSAHGNSFVSQRVVDATLTTCDFESGVQAHIFVSWLHPFKEQKLTVVADRMMAVFDDTQADRKLVLYAHRIDWVDRAPVAHQEPGQVVELAKVEPLKMECQHFLECVANRKRPRTDGASAVRVLQVLESCEQSLRDKGQPVKMAVSERRYFAHPTAIIDEPGEIGEGTKIWHFTHVMAGARLGKRCNLGQNVVISPGVTMGSNVKIQNNVSVYTGVELEDDVFCGPSMVFTNVINPRSHIERKNEYKRTLVRRGASLGANSTIVCGVTVGQYAFVAAGAVVTHDVADYALVAGVPARQVGWVCYCGVRLKDSEAETECGACGRKYVVANQSCREVIQAKQAVAVVAG